MKNPLNLYVDWLLSIPTHFADLIASEILCSFYIWQDEDSSFRAKYDVADEHLADAGKMVALVLDLIRTTVYSGDELLLKHASLNILGITDLIMMSYGQQVDINSLREAQFNFLVEGKIDLADRAEHLSDQKNQDQLFKLRLRTKQSWEEFSSKSFNVETLYKYFF